MKIYFFDTETTGNTAEDRLIQLAITERGNPTLIINELFKPPFPIPFESSAVHHITNKMVEHKPLFKESTRYDEIKALFESPDTIVVAHNSAFDVGMLKAEDIHPTNVICTLKVAQKLDTDNTFTNYKLQYLRYALDMELDVGAHDALADVMVLEKLFEYLLNKMNKDESEALRDMQALSNEPTMIKKFTFGKYNGKTIAEVAASDANYLQWLLQQKKQNPAGEEDWIYTLEKYLLL